MFCISFPFRCRKSYSKWASLNSNRHAMWNQQNSKNILDVGDVVPWMAVKGLLQPSSLRVSSQLMSFTVKVAPVLVLHVILIRTLSKRMGSKCLPHAGKGLMPQLVEVVANETNRSTCKQGYQKFRHPWPWHFHTCIDVQCKMIQNRLKHVQAVSGSKAQQE